MFSGPWNMQIPFQGIANGALSIRFEPVHCTVTVFASSCLGPSTSVVGNFLGGVDLTAQAAMIDDIAIAVVGFDQFSSGLPLPPGCSLHTTPFATLWRSLSGGSEASWSLALPIGIGPVSLAVQTIGLDIDTWSATTSAAYWVTCQ